MKATRAPSASPNYYLQQFQISPNGPSFTGPGRFDPISMRVVPDGFGQIHQHHQQADVVTWAEVKTLIRLPNRLEVIFCGLKYEISSISLPHNRYQTELQMLTHDQDGVMQEKLTLAYHHPAGRWDLAELIHCEIAQPNYTKTTAGCLLFQSLRDPIKGFDRYFFFRKSKHSLISFDNELYFANHRFRTIKKIIRDDNNAPEYDALLKESGHLATRKPNKAETNQGYSNPFEASVQASIDISKLTGCSLEACTLEDGEGMVYNVNVPNEYHLMMGYTDLFANPESFPMRDYTLLGSKQADSYFYKGKGILVSENNVLPQGQGMFCQKQGLMTDTRTTIWHHGEFSANNRSGPGAQLTCYVEPFGDTSSPPRRNFLEYGSWALDKKEGEFSHIEIDATITGYVYVANQLKPMPYVLTRNESVRIVSYAHGSTANQISYYVTLSRASSPHCVKVIDVNTQLCTSMSLISFFEEINQYSDSERFAELILKHASFSDLCFFQFTSRLAGAPELANQFFSSLCGPFPLPDDSHLLSLDISEITSNALWTYLDTAILYLASLNDDSNLYNGALLLKAFYTDPAFRDYAAVLEYFVELKALWAQMLSQKKSMSDQNKRKEFESLLVESALPWVFLRVFMIYSSVLQTKALQSMTLTQEEQTVSKMFHSIRQDSLMAKMKQSCEVLYDLENTCREDIIALERRSFNYFLDTVSLSKAYIEARALLYRGAWENVFEQLKKQDSLGRVEIQEAQKLSQLAIKSALKRLHVMREFHGDECRKRRGILEDEVFDCQEISQAVACSFSQIEQRYLVEESLYRNKILEEERSFFDSTIQEAAAIKARLSFFSTENKCRDEITAEETVRFNPLKIQLQLDYIIQYVSQIPFDRPFDVYIVGSAVMNHVLGHDWRHEQDIDVMIVARSPGEFLQISEANAYRHGLRASQHIFGLYTSFVNVPGAGRRRVDLKVSDCSPILDFTRRDFTVGALYQDSSGVTLDPSQRGLFDLRSKQLNTVQPAAESFHRSPVQMLRAIKYLMNGYTLSQDIVDAMKHWSTHLTAHQRGHICAVVRSHLGAFDNRIYTQALINHGLTQNLFGLSSDLSLEEALRGINGIMFPQSASGFFKEVEERPAETIPPPSFFRFQGLD